MLRRFVIAGNLRHFWTRSNTCSTLLRRQYGAATITLPQTEERVLGVLKKFDKVMPEKLTLEMPFTQMGLDSLDVVEVMINLEDEFHLEIPDNVADKTETPREIAKWIHDFLNPVKPETEDSYSEQPDSH